jgi:hypothetical protein
VATGRPRAPGGGATRGGPCPRAAATTSASRPSISPWKTTSAAANSSGEVVGAGPPAMVRRPAARARASTASIDGACTSMPPTMTTSAHASAASSSVSTLRSTSRSVQSAGRCAARVMRPSGGSVARFPVSGSECWKPQ